MKKRNLITLATSATALLCVGGFVFAENATVKADETKKQTMLGASILYVEGETEVDRNGIRFPVVVADEVAEKITASKTYVLPADYWTGSKAPTAEDVKTNGTAFDTTENWVNYYELDEGYGDEYEEAVVYLYNIPEAKYATDFYVCSWIQLNDETEETSEVISRSMQTVALAAIESEAYTEEQLGKYVCETTYTVNYYTRTVYGNYVATGEVGTVDGYVGVMPAAESLEGYTFNAELTQEANDFTDGATLNFYYENNDYTFTSMGLKGNNVAGGGFTTITDKAMENVSPENVRNVDYFEKNTSNSAPVMHAFSYKGDSVGKYLMLNIYWLTCPNQFGFTVWGNVGGTPEITSDVTTYYQDGKLISPNTTNVLNRWTTIAVYLDSQYYKAEDSSFYVSFDNWSAATLYLGEYRVITEEEFKANYEQPVAPEVPEDPAYEPTEIISGVTKYHASYVVNSGNKASIAGVTNYAKGSRVVVYAKSNKAAPVKMYTGESTSVAANLIYTESGATATEIAANTNYYYVFYFDNAEVAVSGNTGNFFVDTTETNVAATYTNAYILKENMDLAKFKFKVFEENGIEGIEFHAPNRIGRFDSSTGNVSRQADGTYLYEPKKYTWDARSFEFDDRKSLEKGTFVVFKLKFVETIPTAMVFQGYTSSGNSDYYNCRPWYTEDKTYLGWDNYALTADYCDQWLYASCNMRFGVSSITKYQGSFSFARDAKADLEAGKSPKVYIAGIYIMTEEAYKEFFNITNERLY